MAVCKLSLGLLIGVVLTPRAESASPEVRTQARVILGSAMALLQEGALEQARDRSREALATDPTFANAAELLAWCSIRLGEDRAAVDALGRALELKPDDVELSLQLAKIHRQLRQWDRCEELLNQVEATRGEIPRLLRERAELQRERGKVERAMEALVRAKELDPQEQSGRRRLVELYQESGQIPEAIQEIQELLELSPAHRQSLDVHLAHLQLSSGQLREAAIALEKRVEEDPENQALRSILVQLYGGPMPDRERHLFHRSRLEDRSSPRR